ncbi:MAG TPA: CRISPR-associated endonuclease Cas2 [Kofleriaceae bacterium]|nr:CRISPR-associated endonuclease Cas2 [Kofleriaceae bacterium]
MAVDKRWRLVCYDIREPARWRKVYKVVRGAGTHVQYSIFRCRLDDRELEKLRWELSRVMAPEDALLVVDLCPRCAGNVISRNHVEGWDEVPQTFRIIGGGGIDQAPVGVAASSGTSPEDLPEIVGNNGPLETE